MYKKFSGKHVSVSVTYSGFIGITLSVCPSVRPSVQNSCPVHIPLIGSSYFTRRLFMPWVCVMTLTDPSFLVKVNVNDRKISKFVFSPYLSIRNIRRLKKIDLLLMIKYGRLNREHPSFSIIIKYMSYTFS